MAGSLGPVSNLFSIVALAEPWKVVLQDGQILYFYEDSAWTLALNAVSLVLGVLANVSLLANFAGRVKYNLSQAISIGSFYVASVLLLAIIGAEYRTYLSMVGQGDDVQFSQGYWSAVITAVLYFLCGFVLTVNEIGHLRGYYPASFILTSSQRSLMIQILCIIVWLAGGGGVFARLQSYSYGDAVYYCDVTILTIGLGDLHPTRDLSRAIVLPYGLIGVLVLGLVVSNIGNLVISSSRERLALSRVERLRVRQLKRCDSDVTGRTNEDSFNLMREIHHSAKRIELWTLLAVRVVFFCIFWLVGALVFSRLEGWTYFDSVYFCSLCLLTIGYGDFVPTSPGSKSFFVLWSLMAVPLVTILISSLCETIIGSVVHLTNKLGDLTLKNISVPSTSDVSLVILRKMTNDLESRARSRPPPVLGTRTRILNDIDNDNNEVDKALLLINAIQGILVDLHAHRNKKYSYEEWNKLAHALDTQFDWLGADSPIRFPVDEPALLLRLYWNSLKEHLRNRRIT
ncbi:hypothetical protein V1525DRAFT_427106 [Lipomyces kononenkoae]|uniref:Uncharacterized protein n=1 Tax=Lipomyces kononenkoae TaxID=34357 RepID=A0ACC3SXP3_LIPKO